MSEFGNEVLDKDGRPISTKSGFRVFGKGIFPNDLGSLIWGAIITLIITNFAGPCIQRYWDEPEIKIHGILPIHLYTSGLNYELGLIFKVENKSSAQAIVHMAIIEGCVSIDPFAADVHLPEEKRIHAGERMEDIEIQRKNAIQRISISGFLRDSTGSQVIPGFSPVYVGVLFPFYSRVAIGVQGSVALDGKCSAIKVPSTQPSVFEVFNMNNINRWPDGLRPEFANGQLKVSLFVGNETISVDPETIKKLYSLPLSEWSRLYLAQMYENPEILYPPNQKNIK